MRCILFSGVALAALAGSVIAPAHAQMNQPVFARPITLTNCSGVEQCLTVPGYKGAVTIHKADRWQVRRPVYSVQRGPRLPFPPARIDRLAE